MFDSMDVDALRDDWAGWEVSSQVDSLLSLYYPEIGMSESYLYVFLDPRPLLRQWWPQLGNLDLRPISSDLFQYPPVLFLTISPA